MEMSDAQRHFDEFGFVIRRGFIESSVARQLSELAKTDAAVRRHSHAVLDSAGRESRLTLWYAPGDDAFGRLSCCVELTEMMAELLGGPASFFHAKLMQKLPRSGGRWEWHQDYGYWYHDGFLRPDMGSCFVALDAATQSNGCIQIVPGSHRSGRLDHVTVGEQTAADPDRVGALIARHGVQSCELAVGDALFFHANLLHCSGPNLSEESRLGLITTFFRADNESIKADQRFRNKQCLATPLSELPLGRALSADLPFLTGKRGLN